MGTQTSKTTREIQKTLTLLRACHHMSRSQSTQERITTIMAGECKSNQTTTSATNPTDKISIWRPNPTQKITGTKIIINKCLINMILKEEITNTIVRRRLQSKIDISRCTRMMAPSSKRSRAKPTMASLKLTRSSLHNKLT